MTTQACIVVFGPFLALAFIIGAGFILEHARSICEPVSYQHAEPVDPDNIDF